MLDKQRYVIYMQLYDRFEEQIYELKRQIELFDNRFQKTSEPSWLTNRKFRIYLYTIQMRFDCMNGLVSCAFRNMYFIRTSSSLDIQYQRSRRIIFNPRRPQLALFDLEWWYDGATLTPSHITLLKPVFMYCSKIRTLPSHFRSQFLNIYEQAQELDRILFGRSC